VKLQVRSKAAQEAGQFSNEAGWRERRSHQTLVNGLVSDRLEAGRRLRVLTIIDQYHRYSPALVDGAELLRSTTWEELDRNARSGSGYLDRTLPMRPEFVHGLLINGRIYTRWN